MHRPWPLGITLVGALALPGCPIFPDTPYGCVDDSDCQSGYQCDASTGRCEIASMPAVGGSSGIDFCAEPGDCRAGETCTRAGVCAPGSCSLVGYGCVAGFVCQRQDGGFTCVAATDGQGGHGGAAVELSIGGAAGAPPMEAGAALTGGTPATAGGAAGGPVAGQGGGDVT